MVTTVCPQQHSVSFTATVLIHCELSDGKNLSAPEQFRSKEISKSNVVDDMVEANDILYKEGESPDHIVVIKYCPSVGDSKRALDEYVSEIFMG